MPLGKYADLLKALKELPKHLQEFQGIDKDKMIEVLPQLIGTSLPDVINILTIATPLSKDEAENLGIDELTDIVLAIIEVNNYQDVYQKIKKAMARPTQVEPTI